ncbi:hypothetical protein AMATHDRAFT_68969 [Amanita thiersii Skay4041]|uniref:Haloacid dehalogenase n=1 Tax=Amanita thiersii Skay4041 TaxID=703135 RepID=A0A2A9NGS0_9AGAR|nr:hypothetical protein AMATHDRAFT_68969 [Amanita thiersii Skay4041]
MSTPDSNAGTGTGSNGNYHPGPIPPPELGDIQALVFDVFGTVSDWRTGVVKRLAEVGRKSGAGPDVNWNEFVAEWRMGYMIHTRRIAEGGEGPTNTDELHRQLLDDLLDAPTSRWSHLSSLWGENERQQLVLAWHDLDGWPDSTRGLYELKKHYLLSALSNGSVRLLVVGKVWRLSVGCGVFDRDV